jgi:hypothetical protein
VGRGDATGEGPTYNRNTQVGNSSPNLLANQTVRLDREEPFLRIQTVVVFVRDQTRSLQFYLDQLGFSVAFDARSVPGCGWIGVAPPDGTTVLVLIAPEPDSEEYKLIGRPRHVGFITEDIQGQVRDLVPARSSLSASPSHSPLGRDIHHIRRHRRQRLWPCGVRCHNPANRGGAAYSRREARVGTPRRARTGNCKAGAGKALPPKNGQPSGLWSTQVGASRLARSVAIITISSTSADSSSGW